MGIPELEAKQYEGKIKGGNILISVHSENGDETSARKRFSNAPALMTFLTPRKKVSQRKIKPGHQQVIEPNSRRCNEDLK